MKRTDGDGDRQTILSATPSHRLPTPTSVGGLHKQLLGSGWWKEARRRGGEETGSY